MIAGEDKAAVARDFDVDRSTVGRWVDEAGVAPLAEKVEGEAQVAFDDELRGLMADVMRALQAQVRVAADDAFIRSNPADAIELVRNGFTSTERILAMVREQAAEEEPIGDDGAGDPGPALPAMG